MEQEGKGKGSETTINNGEINVGEAQKRKQQGEIESLTETVVHPEATIREIAVEDVQFQMRVDHVTPSGPSHSQLPPPIETLGPPQHFQSSPSYQVKDHELLTPPTGIQDLQNAEDGPNNGVGLPECTTTNSFNQNNAGPTYQTAEGNKQWKVFIRRKGCKQQMTQKDLTNGKATKSIFLGINPHTESIGTATSKRSKEADSQIPIKSIGADEGQIEEALTQWELAKLMWVSTDSEQTTIIHKIIDMETTDKKEAEDLGDKKPAS